MFRTELNIHPSIEKLTLKHSVVSLGSCFADTIGTHLSEYKIETLVNPAGVIYNPYSIGKLINYALNDKTPDDSTYLQNREVFLNFDFHSRVSDTDSEKLKKKIGTTLKNLQGRLTKAKWLIITLGTSVVYTRNDNKEIVANCHKVPAKNFAKGMLTQKQILSIFLEMYKSLMAANPDIQILLTVSPVRHIKDTLEINSVSKSILRITADTLVQEYPNVHYFPSFEIMMDDLRDYRFYADDMIHPSQQAFEYIWQKFCQAYGDTEFQNFVTTWAELKRNLNHRPFHPNTKSHKKFLEDTLTKLKDLSKLVNVDSEIKQLENQLND